MSLERDVLQRVAREQGWGGGGPLPGLFEGKLQEGAL